MKKFVKGCLILAAVCAVLGGVACVTGLVLGAGTGELQQAFRESGLKDWIWEIGSDSSEESFDWEKESDVSKTLDSFSSEEIDSLKIELKYGTLDIEESDTDEVTVKVEKDQKKCNTALLLKIPHKFHLMRMNVLQRKRIDLTFLGIKTYRNSLHDTDIIHGTFLFKISQRDMTALFVHFDRGNRRWDFLDQGQMIFTVPFIGTVDKFFQCRTTQPS